MADTTAGAGSGLPLPSPMEHRESAATSWVSARVRERARRAGQGAAPASWPSFQEALAELSGRGQYPPDHVSRAAQLAWAAREMETQFLQQVWRAMRQTIPEGGFLQKNPAVELFEDMLDEERSHLMAHSGQLGLAQQIYERMIPYVDPDPEN